MIRPGPQLAVASLADRWLQAIVDRSGGRLVGRYRPVRVLGQGGMGVVVHAVDERLGRDVAIKLLRPEFAGDRGFVERFAAEAGALARLHHPNVVQIIDVSAIDPDTPLYVMEFVPGTTLSRRLRDRGRMAWPQAFEALQQVAAALAAIHRVGIVHRDLKPSNLICLDLDDDSLHIKLIDFGIALHAGAPRLTLPGERLGTAPYMAPEQFAGLDLDARTDVYAWGVLALELVAGASPVKLLGDERLAGAPLREAAARLLDEARVPAKVVAIIRQCLSTQPGERFADMGEVARALKALDDGGAPTLMFHRDAVVPMIESVESAAASASASTRATVLESPEASQTQASLHRAPRAFESATGAPGPRVTPARMNAIGTVVATALGGLLIAGAAMLAYQRLQQAEAIAPAFAELPAALLR